MSNNSLISPNKHPAHAAHRPRLSIVIPVFKHSGLVREAMYSISSQPEFEHVDVVFIDDGCPDPQTHSTLIVFSALWANVHYIRHANSGLSAARNRGIAFTLERLPGAEGIYFLDADNFLAPYSISAMQDALRAYPDDDWFYPDIRMFGLRMLHDYSGEFSAYVSSVNNICEAGSLIRRRMIETDLRFDENMRLGYEDWDFWLSAIERGFRGRHLPELGLSYRKRAESMLADSHRSDGQIREYMRRKHESFYQINTFVQREHAELPRFALYCADEAIVEMATDLQIGGSRIGWAAYERRLWQAIREPTFVSAGHYVVTTTTRAFGMLRRNGLARWLAFEIENALETHNFFTLTIESSEDDTVRVERGLPFSRHCHFVAISHELMRSIARDSDDNWITKLPFNGASYSVTHLRLSLPQDMLADDELKDTAVTDLVQFCLHARCSALRTQPDNLVEDVSISSRPLDTMLPRSREQFDQARIPSIAQPREGRLAFVLPHCDFGGVEKVTFCLAREMRRLGFRTSLILLGQDTVYRARYAKDAFDDIYIIDSRQRIAPWAGESFLGTRLPVVMNLQWARDLSNFLATFEMVISCHSSEILGLLSGLRRRDVTTATYLHLFDKSKIGGYYGHPSLALAYEHAIDLVLSCSDLLASEMASLGIPRAKILSLPNAPSLEPTADVRNDLRMRRGEPLRVLYLGRLDIQKGLDRLAAVLDAIGDDSDFDIRIIGKSVLTDGGSLLGRYVSMIEPPIYDDAGLSEVYRWADVLLLPSRYEGLPLTVLEAMAHGVVPIVSDCGAVVEAVETGVSGFVVSQEHCVEGFLKHLRLLASDRAQLLAMSKTATQRMASRSWATLAEQMRDRLQYFRDQRAKARTDRESAKIHNA